MGLMAALVSRGYKVQPFKVALDYIDPSYHTEIRGTICRDENPGNIPCYGLAVTKHFYTPDLFCVALYGKYMLQSIVIAA